MIIVPSKVFVDSSSMMCVALQVLISEERNAPEICHERLRTNFYQFIFQVIGDKATSRPTPCFKSFIAKQEFRVLEHQR